VDLNLLLAKHDILIEFSLNYDTITDMAAIAKEIVLVTGGACFSSEFK
jgi:hypothetical protein